MNDRQLIFSARRKDFRVDIFKSGGPGGQHQNKTDSGVRITHIATGLFAESRAERSQALNKKCAFCKLVDLLVTHYVQESNKERYGAPSAIVRIYHEPDDRVTDPTTGARYSFRHTVGKGRLDEVIDDRAKELAGRNLTSGNK